MSGTHQVRASRDGDQFHYVWAARRCLRLLSPKSQLKTVTIEGVSPLETPSNDDSVAGEEVIDVAEYYGSEAVEKASHIRYIQLKHSTHNTDEPWQPSGLKKTISGFAKRYGEFQENLGAENLEGKLTFLFVSNRPIKPELLQSVEDCANGHPARHPKNLEKLERFTDLEGPKLETFCRMLHLEGDQEALWSQRHQLTCEVSGYLPDADSEAPLELKELVTRKATSEFKKNPRITRLDVLRALKTDEGKLYPAPCRIELPEHPIEREQESDIVQAIIQAGTAPIIIHAEGGVGKSVFASRIPLGLPEGSSHVLYDCFGNGQYRSLSGYRHRHKDALVQIANELASRGFCHPLIPSSRADQSDYVKAFLYRLEQTIDSLRSRNPEAILCIIVDAADNAQMAAEEVGESRSFIRDLLRESLPQGVRLVALCRTHRQESLRPPPEAERIELRRFSHSETAMFLRQAHPGATEQDVEEFHRLSSQNPRVQSLALTRSTSLAEALRDLGPNPTSVEDTIESLLDQSIAKLRDQAVEVEKPQLDRICTGLATLRPLIPLSVLAELSGVEDSAIRSFATDLGRPLLITESSIQFRDEPSETWFRKRFKPTGSDFESFLEKLEPLAEDSAYVASTLPQLMLEAGKLTNLVELALSSGALPESSPVERRDVELQRLQFALKASLRAKRYVDAAKLALKAGGESAGDERQRNLLQANTDLAARFMETDRVRELASRRVFSSAWHGSHYAYEAGLLSERHELRGEARSRLRAAQDWLRNWNRLPKAEREEEELEDADLLEVATALFNVAGPSQCAEFLRGWRPRDVSFHVGRALARRLIDHQRYEDLDALGLAARNNLWLALGINLELFSVGKSMPRSVVRRIFRLMSYRRIEFKTRRHPHGEGETVEAVTALVAVAHRYSIGSIECRIALLSRYLPASPPYDFRSEYSESRLPLLRAYALRATLSDRVLELRDLAEGRLREEVDNPNSYSGSTDSRALKENSGTLLPWLNTWSRTILGRIPEAALASVVAEAKTDSEKAINSIFRPRQTTTNEVARFWHEVLLATEAPSSEAVEDFEHWVSGPAQPLTSQTLTVLARRAAHSEPFHLQAITFACRAFDLIRNARDHADQVSEGYIELARAVLPVSTSEALVYFNQAIAVASRIGDENLDRWTAFLDLADRAGAQTNPDPGSVYRLARCAELTYRYVYRDKHFDWRATVTAISGLCGRSALAVLSRWRDRRFGEADQLLPWVVAFLTERDALDSQTALALLGFRAGWNVLDLLGAALDSMTDGKDKEQAAQFAFRYMAVDRRSSETWRPFQVTLMKHGLKLSGVDNDLILSQGTENALEESKDDVAGEPDTMEGAEDLRDWNAVFEGLDPSTPNGLSTAYRRFLALEPPYYREAFFEQAYQRVPVGRGPGLVAAIGEVAELDLYDLHDSLKSLPLGWQGRLAIQSSIAQTVRKICRRYCMDVSRSRYFQILPLDTACKVSGLTELELVDVVLEAIGESSESISSSRCFTLLSLLGPVLTREQALEALTFGLDLMDPLLEDEDADGPWTEELEPPAEIEGAVAGYIWGCLASPQASLRWEAAHVVRALCTLGQAEVLGHLVALANGSLSARAFYDAGLHFYELHARQWLLIGLARAAKDHPEAVAPHIGFLRATAFDVQPHVLIREFAKRAILPALEANLLESEATLEQELSSLNTSTLSPIPGSGYFTALNGESNEEDGETEEHGRSLFYFGVDIGPYWLAPLGRCFGQPQGAIEIKAARFLRDVLGFTGDYRWESDERHRRGVFRDRETGHSHGTYPRVDDLQFYLSYHAMMVVAGQLLASTPVYQDPSGAEDEFRLWLNGHDLCRRDLGWVADRRDPAPVERPEWTSQKETEQWSQSILPSDFDRALGLTTEWLDLWSYCTWIKGSRKETIMVRSALVPPSRSLSLLRALQSVEPIHYRIPSAEDNLEIESGSFRLKGWVDDAYRDHGLDERDPWAGDISYPPPAPACYVVEQMNLSSDPEQRQWFIQDKDLEVARSRVWGESPAENGEEWEPEHGSRLQVSHPFMVALLRELAMDLIIQVKIERARHYYPYERARNDVSRSVTQSVRLYLLKTDGSLVSL